MKTICLITLGAMLIPGAPLLAQESGQMGDHWSRVLQDRSQRAALHDSVQYVRGDSGKWQDEAQLILAPSIARKPAKTSLDNWADQLLEQPVAIPSSDDNWLLVRTRQMDDNDRVWVERIERQGNQFTIVMNDAVWQGKYQKNFTYYAVVAVNLGKLAPGKYQARCVLQPMAFKQLDGPPQMKDSWPKDEQRAEKKPMELNAAWNVSPGGR